MLKQMKKRVKKFLANLTLNQRAAMHRKTREFKRWENGWKRNARFNGKPLTRSMIRRVGSRERAIEKGLIKA